MNAFGFLKNVGSGRPRGRFAARLPLAFPDVRSLGPYLLIELLLPGGSLIALSLFIYNRWRASTA